MLGFAFLAIRDFHLLCPVSLRSFYLETGNISLFFTLEILDECASSLIGKAAWGWGVCTYKHPRLQWRSGWGTVG